MTIAFIQRYQAARAEARRDAEEEDYIDNATGLVAFCDNCGRPLDPDKGHVFATKEGGEYCADHYPLRHLLEASL